MALTPEQKTRRIALLQRKKAILLKSGVTREPKPSTFEFGGGKPAGVRTGSEVTGSIGATGSFALKSIFPEITPEEQVKRPFVAAGQKTGKELVSVPANFFNQLLLNAPRSLTEKAGFEFPSEVERPSVKVAGKVAGVTGAIKTPIIKFAKKATEIARLPKALKGATEGAIIGGAVSPEDFTDLEQRGQQAIGGGLLGAGFQATGAAVKGTRGLFRKGLSKVRESKAGKLASETIVRLRREIEDANIKLKSTIETVKVKSKALKDRVIAGKALLEDQIENDISKASGKLSAQTQEASKKFISENSKRYGQRLDAIDKNLTTKQREAIDNFAVLELANRSKEEAAEALITEGAGIDALTKISEAFGVVGGQLKRGKLQVGLKELLKVTRDAKNSLSTGAKAGTRGFTADDIPIEIFKKNVGLFLESIGVDDVKDLNRGYAPVMELTKKINATFKPFKGVLDSGRGQQVFKSILSGKAQKLEETELVRRLKTGEKGFAKGIGDIDKSAKDAIKSLKGKVSQLERRGTKITQIEKKQIVTETRKITDAISQKKIDIRKLEDIVRKGKDATGLLRTAGISLTALSATGLLGFVTKKLLLGIKSSKK